MKKVFIDGQAGTTGLQIHSRLKDRTDIGLIEVPDRHRKDPVYRKEMINNADLVVLCLPDESAIEAVSLIESDSVRVLDASSAHRVQNDWVYGLPELSKEQQERIRNARLVSNPGCYPTGAILLMYPLIANGLISSEYPYAINAVSGYSGGGRDAIERFENREREDYIDSQVRRYALHHEHKHIKEMQKCLSLTRKPIFMPSYGRYRQGIVLQVPIHLSMQNGSTTADELRQAIIEHYADSCFVQVLDEDQTKSVEGIDPEIHNNSNSVTLGVFSPKDTDHAVLIAVYDNLGKGASGAAVQNLEIMLDLEQSDGRVAQLD